MFSDEIVTLNHKKKITGKKYIFLAAISIKGIDDQSHKLKLSVQNCKLTILLNIT